MEILAFVIAGALLLFAPNPDVDGDGYGEQLRITQENVYVENVSNVEEPTDVSNTSAE